MVRRLNPRARVIAAAVLVAVGLALVIASALLSAGLFVHGAILVVTGMVLGWRAVVNRRRVQRTHRSDTDNAPIPAGDRRGR